MEAIASRKAVEKYLSCHESARLASKSLTIPIPKEHHSIELRNSHIADIILQVGWETNTSHAECGQLDPAVNILILLSLLGACPY